MMEGGHGEEKEKKERKEEKEVKGEKEKKKKIDDEEEVSFVPLKMLGKFPFLLFSPSVMVKLSFS